MQGAVSTFWGKLSRSEPRTWHPLLHHCADVAACCEALLSRTLLGTRLAAWGELAALDEVQIARLSVLAALHDIGKFNRGFQAWCQDKPVGTCGHVQEVLVLFSGGFEGVQERLIKALPVSELRAWGDDDVAFKLLIAAIGHHGRPFRCDATPEKFNRLVWSDTPFGDPMGGIASLVSATRRWLPRAYEPVGATLPHHPEFQHGFAGLVMLADWLGSHTDFFPYSEALDTDRMSFARGAAIRALSEVGLDAAPARGALGAARPIFSTISPHIAPAPAQSCVGELPVRGGGSLTILEAETGSGKTEAALLRFAQLFHAGLVDGLYFALPTRTAATQIHRRVLESVERAFPEGCRPPVVLAVPGYLRVDDVQGKHLPNFEVLWNDNAKEGVRHRGWAAENPKRFLAGAVVVGTIDQLLLSTIMVSHAHLRATAAARLLAVIDEVHASDAYMNCLTEQVLKFHLRAHGHAFLMSATLGAAARTRLVNAVGAGATCPTFEQAQAAPYPLLTHVGGASRELHALAVSPGARTRAVRPRLHPFADHAWGVAVHALAAAARGARVLIVRNVVRSCIETQRALEDLAKERGESHLLFHAGGVLAPHHSRFARKDRELLDRAVEAEFGKSRPVGRGCVLVATQTVEQSLDLDADLLLTDLCPMDVLLQRIGRLHRHDRGRPLGFESPCAGILVPDKRELGRHICKNGEGKGPHGYGVVYSDLRILEATWRVCEEHEVFQIPADNRHLVERTTHPERLESLTRELGGAWAQHATYLRGRLATDKKIAHFVLIDRGTPFGEVGFADEEQVGKIATRLGHEDRTILFNAPQMSPFGEEISSLILPHHMLRGEPTSDPVQVLVEPDALVFPFGDATYRYDRLGLQET